MLSTFINPLRDEGRRTNSIPRQFASHKILELSNLEDGVIVGFWNVSNAPRAAQVLSGCHPETYQVWDLSGSSLTSTKSTASSTTTSFYLLTFFFLLFVELVAAPDLCSLEIHLDSAMHTLSLKDLCTLL
jgi:hypothetical protein